MKFLIEHPDNPARIVNSLAEVTDLTGIPGRRLRSFLSAGGGKAILAKFTITIL